MVVRSTGGDVELLSAATSICVGNTAFGAYKWGKLSFRTSVGMEVKPKDGPYPLDASLTAEAEDGSLHGRQTTHPVEIEAHHISCVYALGGRSPGLPGVTSQFNVQVESHIWWHGGWQLHVHHYHAHQPSRLILGGYSLAADDPAALHEEESFPFVRAKNDIHSTALQALSGFTEAGCRLTLTAEKPRAHTLAPNSLDLFFQTSWICGEGCLVALTWVGPMEETPQPWTVKNSSAGCLSLTNQNGERWDICHEAIPSFAPRFL